VPRPTNRRRFRHENPPSRGLLCFSCSRSRRFAQDVQTGRESLVVGRRSADPGVRWPRRSGGTPTSGRPPSRAGTRRATEMFDRGRGFGNVSQGPPRQVPGRARATQLTFFPDRVSGRAVSNPKTGDSFIFSKDTGRQRVLPVLPVRLRRREHDPADRRQVAQTRAPRWSNAGTAIAYGSTRRTGQRRRTSTS